MSNISIVENEFNDLDWSDKMDQIQLKKRKT